MLKACDACADMGQLQRTVPIWKTFQRDQGKDYTLIMEDWNALARVGKENKFVGHCSLGCRNER